MKLFALTHKGREKDAAGTLSQLVPPGDFIASSDRKLLEARVSESADQFVYVDLTHPLSQCCAPELISKAIQRLESPETEALIFLDPTGEELPFLKAFEAGARDRPLSGNGRARRVFPIVVRLPDSLPYQPEAHTHEAEMYRDRIGQRLFSPQAVPADQKRLIRDDVRRTQRLLSLPIGERLLDLGCSDGSVTIEVARNANCREVVGTDVAASAIEEANRRLATQTLAGTIRFIETFIESLDFPNGHFDTILAAETLEHVGAGQLNIALDNAVRMLNHKGNLIVTVPNRCPHPEYEAEGRSRWKWPAHHHFFTRHSLESLLSAYFHNVEFHPLYPGESPGDSIYLIANSWNKRRHPT